MTHTDQQTKFLLTSFCALTVVSLIVGIAGYWYFLAAIPPALLLAYVAVVDFKKIFFLLFAMLPFTVEVWLPNGTVTDVPDRTYAGHFNGDLFFVCFEKWAGHVTGDLSGIQLR